MDGSRRAYIFDANPVDLRGRASQLRSAGVAESWEIHPICSRNHLLADLLRDAGRSPRRQSVALIDARSESGDLEQLGFKIIETIRRHEFLWKSTRPVIWLDELTEENRLYAGAVGAEAVLDDDWVDRTDGEPLFTILDWVAGRPCHPYDRAPRTPRTFSDRESDLEAERRLRDQHFERWFGFTPDDLDYKLLWGLADAVELKFLFEYCEEQGWAESKRAARRACERLQQAMRPEKEELDRPEPTNAELARRFLAEAAPATPDPLSEIAWPTMSHIQELMATRPDITRLAFLEQEAKLFLERFFIALDHTAAHTAARHEAIEAAIAQVAKGAGRSRAAVHCLIHRSCHALDDACEDWRRHGEPGSSDA